MIIELKIPSPGESISEVEISNWFVKSGDYVEKGQEIGEVESEKATLPLIAEQAGKVSIKRENGETVPVGEVVCTIDTSAGAPEKKAEEVKEKGKTEVNTIPEEKAREEKEAPKTIATEEKPEEQHIRITPVARKMMDEHQLSMEDILSGLRKITSSEVEMVLAGASSPGRTGIPEKEISRESNRTKMSALRKKLSDRLVAVKNQTAMLTTFNEADMSAVMKIRSENQAAFTARHGIKLGFMSFFTMAAARALQDFPVVNSYIDGEDIVTPEFCDIGIAVQTEKGLMVPVVRNAGALSLAGLEQQIADLAVKARKNRISIDEMSGGTFTITNGGIFGSMLSTPILNPPQSAILGMHNILERPVAVNGKVEIRPMMYLALSYDHRIIDGRDSVGFLKRVKEYIESPINLLYGPGDPAKALLGIE